VTKVRRQRLTQAATVTAMALSPAAAHAFVNVSVGGHEGEIDVNAHFTAEIGQLEPTERTTTFQPADIKILNVGAGYTIGDLGPFSDFYVRLDGHYYIAGDEAVERDDDDLPAGTPFFGEDKGGYITATIATNFVHEARFSFGGFLQGTVPIDVNLQKFGNVRIHYVSGGTTVGVFITDPTKVVRLAYANRLFFGSGTYDGEAQINANVAITNLFVIEAARWLLPWRAGIAFGPYVDGDLNEHVNPVYNRAYGAVTPDLVAGDRIRMFRFAIMVLPYIRITDHAALEFGYVQKLFGYDTPATQFWTGGVRATF
jgi:hypothetical protein